MGALDAAYAARDLVISRLEEDLLGGPQDDTLSEAPLSRFIVGVLFPTEEGRPSTPEENTETDLSDESHGEDAETFADPGISMARVRYPSSIGLTFAVADAPGAGLVVRLTAASYSETSQKTWERRVVDETLTIPVRQQYSRIPVVDGLELAVNVRRPGPGGVPVTLALVNTQAAARGQRDGRCWFNPVITVTPENATFVERPAPVIPGTNADEVAGQSLLYRGVRSFAVGHGCGVTWDDAVPTSVRTTFLPTHELLLSEAAGGADLDLSMQAFGDGTDLRPLEQLVEGYRSWIEDTSASGGALDEGDRVVLDRHLDQARAAAARMEAGVELLRSDAEVLEAFRLMNRAMAQQRSRQEHHRSGGIGDPTSELLAKASWRPFQLAFILTNLRGLADPASDDRRIADVLWFPTGGGKTEAYLGLIGIAILLRRIRNAEAAGVSVLMRYTLRLLTLQQYERATGLVCALEQERSRALPDSAPVSIGLWVGQGSTPNDAKTAKDALRRLRRGEHIEDGPDPVQLRRCPWCGTAMGADNYEIVDDTSMDVKCGNDACRYRSGLPVHIIDSDVYANAPSLVIGTVDKFAMMPWKREVGTLLGAGGRSTPSRWDELPPDLVIQDELHLISGPLGTVVGLYETAIDAIVGHDAPPKVVASTATIRRAAEQVRAVFAREARQFPPPGLTYRDSYFAVEASRDVKASRGYVGVMAPGSSHATLMIRVYASLLQSGWVVPAADPTGDLYWTLLGYFNSLRVLGGARMQVIDDVPDQIKVVAQRRGEEPRPIGTPREMTSRISSSDIPRELEMLGAARGHRDSADVVLATNMISVGVDVDRLGLMAVMGQPQTTSEYIQATSRVGRRMPGLVVTIYNASRSRDLSHYENFAGYHRALYRHVEATSATPFAPRARDRALHAVLVSLMRHTVPEAGPSTAAGDAANWREGFDEAVATVLRRLEASRIGGPTSDDESSDVVRDELDGLVDAWVDASLSHYEGWFGRDQGALLSDAGRAAVGGRPEFPPTSPAWPTLTSMRDVDAESRIYLHEARRSRR